MNQKSIQAFRLHWSSMLISDPLCEYKIIILVWFSRPQDWKNGPEARCALRYETISPYVSLKLRRLMKAFWHADVPSHLLLKAGWLILLYESPIGFWIPRNELATTFQTSWGGIEWIADHIFDVPDSCPKCGHKLVGTESICPKCGHCVICQRPQEYSPEPDSQRPVWRPGSGHV